MNPSRFSLSVVAGVAGLLLSTAAYADGLNLPMDQVRVITFKSPAKTVYIANPVIADVTVIDPTHVFLLGKNVGTTNLVAVDAEGNETFNDVVTVLNRPGTTVLLQRGTSKMTLLCVENSVCGQQPTPGDGAEPFAAITGQQAQRDAQAKAGGN